MEYSENDLKNVIAGTNQEVSEEFALKNAELFRDKKIEELKEQREQLKSIKAEEIELEQKVNK